MLRLETLTKTYRTAEVETLALNAVSLTIKAGEFVAIMGPSGCGKSTLMNLMGLLDAPSSGRMEFFGADVDWRSDGALTDMRRDHIGFVFQNFNLIDELSVLENVEVPLLYRRLPRGERRERALAALERVGLSHRARHRPRQLSGGQQQRVAVARALAPSPKLILADEPTGNLDTANGEAVMDLLKSSAASGVTVVMVTHSPAHAAEAGRTIRMLDGCVVSQTVA